MVKKRRKSPCRAKPAKKVSTVRKTKKRVVRQKKDVFDKLLDFVH